MHMQMQQLESEIAKLQVELREVRQLIGSLIRTEQETRSMINQTHLANNNQSNYQPMMQANQQTMRQFEQMRSTADRMNDQLRNISQSFTVNPNANAPHLGDMNPPHNDPMQRQF
ncbi:MAG TPA: hypothetical protein VFV52_11395 [Bacilli bacterium]|nr:hypothetical protein [Bacilli bacterium]